MVSLLSRPALLVAVVLVGALPQTAAHFVPSAPLTPFEGKTEMCGGEAPAFTQCSTGQHVFVQTVEQNFFIDEHPNCHRLAACYNGILRAELYTIPPVGLAPPNPVPPGAPLSDVHDAVQAVLDAAGVVDLVAIRTCRYEHWANVSNVEVVGLPHGLAHGAHDIRRTCSDDGDPVDAFVGRPFSHQCESLRHAPPEHPGGSGAWLCEIEHL